MFIRTMVLMVGVLAASSSQAADLKKVLSCGDGNLIVDVDQNSPRVIQAVIQQGPVLDYLVSKGIVRNHLDDFHQKYNGQKPELLLLGRNENRVYSGEDLSYARLHDGGSFSRQGFNLLSGFGPYQRHAYVAHFYPEAGGFKLRIDEILGEVSFSTDCNPSTGCRGSVYFPREELGERANWFFDSCEKL